MADEFSRQPNTQHRRRARRCLRPRPARSQRGPTRGVQLDFTRPGKPTNSGQIESFRGRLRDECLNVQQLLSLDDARAKLKLGSGTAANSARTAP
ncbi:MAG: transposase [Gemmatimonadetes bacterium]|nr:transposase [Gemmatimonadota bacterium]